MTREITTQLAHKTALLATGDEITNGDILNSNSQVIAQKLFRNGIPIGAHLSVSDNTSDIEQAINYLLKSHRILIITGGLGPTSDDLTRYALSKALQLPLIFNEKTWNEICDRFKILGYKSTPPEGNRQQALFPETATLIANPAGTAAGCVIAWQQKFIFMLPGPPIECLPMVDHFVIPYLLERECQEVQFYNTWLLFGVSESVIAEQLDTIAKPFNCMTGYRLAYPYIEFKLYSHNEKDFKALNALVEKAVAPYLISDGKQTAAMMLQKQLAKLTFVLGIRDTATGGLLETTLLTPENHARVNFLSDQPEVRIQGLIDFWQGNDVSETHLEIIFSQTGSERTITKPIPLRGRSSRVKQFAVEFICQQIYQFLT